jgi:hypothetical protein
MKHMTSILRVVNGIFTHALKCVYPKVPELTSTVQHSGSRLGDYTCTAAMPIAKVLECISELLCCLSPMAMV